jgi:saccharopine dehydrogenase (NAD+, L-lysine-forming)
MAIDHLPSFLPRESSIDFSNQLLPHLQALLEEGATSAVWEQAARYYYDNVNA